jgi:predicted secreted acid phosphatase
MMRPRAAAAFCSVLATLTALVVPVPAAEAAVPSQEQWAADVNQAMAGSRVYLRQRVAQGGTRLAVNLDIDNTSLASHYAYGQAVSVVLRFADYAETQGVTLLFNTGRVRGNGALAAVARDLRRAGYAVGEVCGRASSGEGLADGKQRCRRHFVDEGYTIIANVGNRRTDFTGGDYERAFRLPSYGNQLA